MHGDADVFELITAACYETWNRWPGETAPTWLHLTSGQRISWRRIIAHCEKVVAPRLERIGTSTPSERTCQRILREEVSAFHDAWVAKVMQGIIMDDEDAQVLVPFDRLPPDEKTRRERTLMMYIRLRASLQG